MKVAIIGAGFGGLAAGYKLAKQGAGVTIFESESYPGGLAVGFKDKKWKWSLERHYHHWFSNDESVLNLANEIGYEVLTVRPKTSTFYNGNTYQLDSPLSLLTFSELSFTDRIRTGTVLAYLKFSNNWKKFEKFTAKEYLIKFMGQKSWEVLWQPLFEKKFGQFADEISASWFWARIKKRTPSLSYPKSGFADFAWAMDKEIRKYHGKIFYKTRVEKIVKHEDKLLVKIGRNFYKFDKVICTLPSPLFVKLVDGLPENYLKNMVNLKGIGAINLVLSLNKQFLEDGTYWLNINAAHFPFLAIVEHTNFMDKKHYNNEHMVYIGNYLPHEHPYFKKEAVDLIREFQPYLSTINPKFDKKWINSAYLFKAPFAQPIIPTNYLEKVPAFETPIKDLYLCNIQQVYPWDRGTNYAVELGQKVADLILRER